MSDKINSEDEDVVEGSPAPLHPRSDSVAAVSRGPTGGSPFRDEIDELVDASIRRGPHHVVWMGCPNCGGEWHGLQNKKFCQGSHL